MFKTTTSRLAFVLLGYITLIILLMTWNPFYFAIPEQIHFKLHTDLDDALANVILFMPVGFLYRLTTQKRGAWLVGAAISASIEMVQLFIPARTSSLMDILNNTLGAVLGAVLYNLISSRVALTPNMAGRLRLETPLMSFVYLLIPLLWINSVAQREASDRWFLSLMIGMCGAIVFNDVYRHWFDSTGMRLTLSASLSAGAWFLFGAGINILHPFLLIRALLVVVLLTAFLTVLPRRFPDRRFERATLRRLLPVFVVYIILLALWSPGRPFVGWHGMIGLTSRIEDTSMQALYSRIEYLVAFSILGYLTAEWRGRAELSVAQDLPGLLAVTGGSAIVLALFAGFQAGEGASLFRFILVVASAIYGGLIYHALRDHVRFLLRHTMDASSLRDGRSPAVQSDH